MSLYKIIFILISAFFVHISYGQYISDKDSAISIAMKNGLEQGLDPPTAKLEYNIWEITCLLCTGINSALYQTLKIYAKTGEVIENKSYWNIWLTLGWSPTDNTNVDFTNKTDSSLKKILLNEPIRLTKLSDGNEYNPTLSPDNYKVCFQNDSDIYIVSINTQNAIKICENCQKPNWLDNDWIVYFRKNESQIYKINIKTGENLPIIKLPKAYSDDYALTKNNEWIAYISKEVWDIPDVYIKKGLFKKKVFHYTDVHINGRDRDLCLMSRETGDKKYITKVARYVHSPIWSLTGDTLFFYMEDEKYFIDNFKSDTIKYSKFNELENITIWDFQKARQGQFPYLHDCKVYSIDLKTLTPISILINKRGRYGALIFTDNLEYLIFTQQECRDCDSKIWKLKLN